MPRTSQTPDDQRLLLVSQLQELVDALDRRIPQVRRLGEADIARDAAALKQTALARVAELTAAIDRHPADAGAEADRSGARIDGR